MSLTPEQLAALREEYSSQPMRRAEVDPDPLRRFARWLAAAHAEKLPEPNAMTLATVDAAGQPWSRTVLLKACDERGFTFFTNYGGAKGRQLGGEPRAALTFWWAGLERQVNVTGTVVKTSRAETAAYFATRPRKSQLGAWASRQSEVLADRAQLERQQAETEARFGVGEIAAPEDWGGFILRPETVEFWQGQRSRLHDRLRYRREGEGWVIERLSP